MTAAELREFEALKHLPKDTDDNSQDWIMVDDVLDGTHELNISHEGGELSALQDMADDDEVETQ